VSYSIDANVLLYGSDSSSPNHAKATEFLRSCAASRELLCLGWPTLMTYLRIATHPSIFSNPLSPAEAARNVEALLSLPHVRVLSEGDDFWAIYKDVTEGQVVRGNLVPDAHLAALLKQDDVSVLYSADADFRRFTFLEVRNPFD
jgi:toxin-antitoxin system PIN domain toxin